MKFGIYYNYEVEDRDWTNAYHNSFLEVQLAEKYGFDLYMVAEHHFQKMGITPSPLMVCGAMGVMTQKMSIASGVVLLPEHNPIRVAEDAIMADILCKGRFILGLGIGWNRKEYEEFRVPFNKRGAIFEESLIATRKLLDETNVSFSGKHIRFENITVMPRPERNIPIWVAAIEEKAVRRAGKFGHVWIYPPGLPIKILKQRIQAYKEELKKIGKDFEELDHPLRREAYIATDSNAAKEYARRSTEEHYRYYHEEGLTQLDENGNVITTKDPDEFWNALSKRFIMGNPDEFIEQVAYWQKETDATMIILKLHGTKPKEYHNTLMNSIKLIGEKVIPYFKDEAER
jgi:alkanesulfonate monooxygenase SsuD/methylene tetrahydromethanopterin reductase-like flavin-dependent oxidoreductase (luciferase family)